MVNSAGTATFFQRFDLTQRLEDMVVPVLDEAGIAVEEYGQNMILGHNGSLEAYLKKLKAKKSSAALVVKFAPDLLCRVRETHKLFFVDIKTSLTPVLFDSKLREIEEIAGIRGLTRERVGLIEREAWDNYRSRYPGSRTAILMACPYHPRLLVMEWARDIVGLFRFQEDINQNAAGSRTPHQNIDLNSMRTVQQFLAEELAVHIDETVYQLMIEFVKTWPLSNPGRPWRQFNGCVEKMQLVCPWLRRRDKNGWIDPDGPRPNLGLKFS